MNRNKIWINERKGFAFKWIVIVLTCVIVLCLAILVSKWRATKDLPFVPPRIATNITTPAESVREPSPPSSASAPDQSISKVATSGCDRLTPNQNSADMGAWAASTLEVGNAARQTLISKLIGNPEPELHAAGLFLASTGTYATRTNCDNTACEYERLRNGQYKSNLVGELSNLAKRSDSPTLYSWAYAACINADVNGRKPAQCGDLSLERWVQLAPSSPWPWFLMAHYSMQRGDLSAQHSAIYQASLATQWSGSSPRLLQIMTDNLPPETNNLARLQILGIEASNAEGLLSLPGGSSLAYCSTEDVNRQQVCAQLANRMIQSADNLSQLSAGISIGEKAGLPKDFLKAAKDDLAQLTSRGEIINSVKSTDISSNCQGIEQQISYIGNRIARGEIAALREKPSR